MANRYANLVGGNKIKDEYTKINSGFDQVEVEIDEGINGWKRFGDITELGLTPGSETMEAICAAMPNRSILRASKVTSNPSTAYPHTAGLLTVVKWSSFRTDLHFSNAGTGGTLQMWGGFYDENVTPNFTGWKLVPLLDVTNIFTTNQIISASDYRYWGVRRDVGGTEYGAELAVSASGYAQIGRRVAGSFVAPSLFLRDDNVYVGNDAVWNAGNLPYESGTWTPELNFGGSTSGIAYSVQEGRYTRIGNRVFFEINITLSSKGSATGDATISGFPFASISGLPYTNMVVGYSSITLPANATGMALFLGSNTTNALIRRIGNNESLGASFDDTHFSNSSVIRASGSYPI